VFAGRDRSLFSLQEIPSTGVDKWFALEGRSETSKVRGQIHLRANLTTREDRGVPEEDNWTDIKQHVELIQIFVEYELGKNKVRQSTVRSRCARAK
jgi:BAI1-associated protein 3